MLLFGRLSSRLSRTAKSISHCEVDVPKAASRSLSRTLSTLAEPVYDLTEEEWTAAFTAETEKVQSEGVSFIESSNIMRELTQTNLLHGTDLRDHPERFFEAHRLLARKTVEHGPGFWIRFTVHYNLFAGTILAVGSDEQVDDLAAYQAEGKLGCFSLTEKLAGVLSGFIVDTTATYDRDIDGFVINSPTTGSKKNWISQGFTADKTVVLADLRVGGESKGPHAFVMDFRAPPDNAAGEAIGQLVPGISCHDMGKKTVGNDLDNAEITFDGVVVPRSALLSRYSEVDAVTGEYVVKAAGVSPFERIGQRLYTGRVAVAQAALEYRKELFARTRRYSDHKKMALLPGQKDERVLSDMPQLARLFADNARRTAEIEAFVGSCERALCEVLRDGGVPPPALVDAIATAKVVAVEDSIDFVHRLKQDVGSYALMADSSFQHTDFLQCCKFAEGDSRILMQKLARDRFRRFTEEAKKSEGLSSLDSVAHDPEVAACLAVADAMKAHGGAPMEAWDAAWEEVYALANTVMERTIAENIGGTIYL